MYVSNYFAINHNKLEKSDLVVFSPGPGEPKDYPKSSFIYNSLKGRKKILGICLGFQQILFNENGKIIQQKKIYRLKLYYLKINQISKILNRFH